MFNLFKKKEEKPRVRTITDINYLVEIENKYVFAQVEDKWYKVGRLKKTADLDGELTLYLYPNEYKYVTEDSVEKDKGSHYFGIEVKKTITL